MKDGQVKKIFLFAGEPSGDLHGSHLIKALKNLAPDLVYEGVGGQKMRDQGLNCLLKTEDFSVMGFSDVLKAFPKLYQQFYFIRDTILSDPPALIVLIDYPGFNLRLAKSLRKKDYKGKIVQYICPSVWAHGKGRIKTLCTYFDLLLTIYPFEKNYFNNTSLQVEYVGHPLYEILANHSYKDSIFPVAHHLIALFPGSRYGEIARNFPKLLEATSLIKQAKPDVVFAVSCSSQEIEKQIQNLIQISNIEFKEDIYLVPKEFSYELMKNCSAAIAKSGTVTLELALHKKPAVVVYELSKLNRFIAKHLLRLRLPYYCIVNILKNGQVYPELIEHGFNAQNTAKELLHFLNNDEKREECLKHCQEIQTLLGKTNASQTAARLLVELIQ